MGGGWLEPGRKWTCEVEMDAYGVEGSVHGRGGIDGLSRWMVWEWRERWGWVDDTTKGTERDTDAGEPELQGARGGRK